MQIWTTGWEHAPNLTADVTIVDVVHGSGVLQYAFLSTEILKIKTSESSMTKDRLLVCWNDWIKTLLDQNVAIGFSLFSFFCMLI